MASRNQRSSAPGVAEGIDLRKKSPRTSKNVKCLGETYTFDVSDIDDLRKQVAKECDLEGIPFELRLQDGKIAKNLNDSGQTMVAQFLKDCNDEILGLEKQESKLANKKWILLLKRIESINSELVKFTEQNENFSEKLDTLQKSEVNWSEQLQALKSNETHSKNEIQNLYATIKTLTKNVEDLQDLRYKDKEETMDIILSVQQRFEEQKQSERDHFQMILQEYQSDYQNQLNEHKEDVRDLMNSRFQDVRQFMQEFESRLLYHDTNISSKVSDIIKKQLSVEDEKFGSSSEPLGKVAMRQSQVEDSIARMWQHIEELKKREATRVRVAERKGSLIRESMEVAEAQTQQAKDTEERDSITQFQSSEQPPKNIIHELSIISARLDGEITTLHQRIDEIGEAELKRSISLPVQQTSGFTRLRESGETQTTFSLGPPILRNTGDSTRLIGPSSHHIEDGTERLDKMQDSVSHVTNLTNRVDKIQDMVSQVIDRVQHLQVRDSLKQDFLRLQKSGSKLGETGSQLFSEMGISRQISLTMANIKEHEDRVERIEEWINISAERSEAKEAKETVTKSSNNDVAQDMIKKLGQQNIEGRQELLELRDLLDSYHKRVTEIREAFDGYDLSSKKRMDQLEETISSKYLYVEKSLKDDISKISEQMIELNEEFLHSEERDAVCQQDIEKLTKKIDDYKEKTEKYIVEIVERNLKSTESLAVLRQHIQSDNFKFGTVATTTTSAGTPRNVEYATLSPTSVRANNIAQLDSF